MGKWAGFYMRDPLWVSGRQTSNFDASENCREKHVSDSRTVTVQIHSSTSWTQYPLFATVSSTGVPVAKMSEPTGVENSD